MQMERLTGSSGIEERSLHAERIELVVERVGERPGVMFLAGLHGDEGGVIPPLRGILTELTADPSRPLGDYIHLLEACPQALEKRTRAVDGVDLNRQFFASPTIDHPYAGKIAEIIHAHPDLHTLFTFHEDTEEDGFYFYDHPSTTEFEEKDAKVHAIRDRLLGKVQALGIPLYTGIDGPGLGNVVVNGYVVCRADGAHDNTLEMWAVNKTHVNHPNLTRSFAFEVPRRLSQEKKNELLATIFTDFILPYLDQHGIKAME